MFGGKRYGEAKIAVCPFCGGAAYTKNKDGLPVCASHKNSTLGEIKCACGAWLEMREGKWGPFFTCDKCGIINMSKAVELQRTQQGEAKPLPTAGPSKKPHPMMGDPRLKKANALLDEYGREKFIRSDDPRFEFR